MKISGRKTASIFPRYDITDEADLADAARRLDEQRRATSGTVSEAQLLSPMLSVRLRES
jgi:hypothetical protein